MSRVPEWAATRPLPQLPAGFPIHVSLHAVERYLERVSGELAGDEGAVRSLLRTLYRYGHTVRVTLSGEIRECDGVTVVGRHHLPEQPETVLIVTCFPTRRSFR